jgi:hypothetical protein
LGETPGLQLRHGQSLQGFQIGRGRPKNAQALKCGTLQVTGFVALVATRKRLVSPRLLGESDCLTEQ